MEAAKKVGKSVFSVGGEDIFDEGFVDIYPEGQEAFAFVMNINILSYRARDDREYYSTKCEDHYR